MRTDATPDEYRHGGSFRAAHFGDIAPQTYGRDDIAANGRRT